MPQRALSSPVGHWTEDPSPDGEQSPENNRSRNERKHSKKHRKIYRWGNSGEAVSAKENDPPAEVGAEGNRQSKGQACSS